jgi:2-iminoacetate synthase
MIRVPNFDNLRQQWPEERLESLYASVSDADVRAALNQEHLSIQGLAALLSPAARPFMEAMAQKAQGLTRQHFGRTISLYAPIYLSNACAADCTYCGFAALSGSTEKRITLDDDGLDRECEALAKMGYQNVLLVTGEAPNRVTVDKIARAVGRAREHFAGVSVEIYALDEPGYRQLCEAGLEGVTLYMETYHEPTYEQVHLRGQKKDYAYRLDAMERAGRAGTRRLSLGVLLGLYRWRIDALWLALHAQHLQKVCWKSALSLSFPRLRHTPERFQIAHPVSDRNLVKLMLALRIFLPEAGFNLSTREAPEFRDRLIPLGVTSMSAGSSTRPGGYAENTDNVLEQFEVDDTRSPAEVVQAIRNTGYDPVWKDFDAAFDGE